MSLYYEAAALIANTEKAGGSLKSRLFKQKDLKSSPAQLFALISETSKWSLVLKDVIDQCGLLSEERKLTPILALLLTHDLLISKNGIAAPANHVLKLAIQRHKARISAEFTKARIRRGHATLEAFKHAVADGELEKGQESLERKVRHPRWVRINTLKSTLAQQLSTTFAGFKRANELSEVLPAPGSAKIYFEDPHIPTLLAFPPRLDLSKSSAYTSGEIIFQDKASCFPAYLLNVMPEDGDAIDGCAAPGNKTTHLAAVISDRKVPGQLQKVIAFEKDRVRTATLKKMVQLASAAQVVSIKGGADFLVANPDSKEFANVGAILLDPSCSGSGIVGRDDAVRMHLPDPTSEVKPVPNTGNRGKKRKRDQDVNHSPGHSATLKLEMEDSPLEESPVEEKLSDRLDALSTFQLRLLKHAMRFPKARKITYSTCSIHFEENEGVVFRALASEGAKERGWKVLKREDQIDGLKRWERRGTWDAEKIDEALEVDDKQREEICNACIRCMQGTDEGTMGFFVAAFVRDEGPRESCVAESANGAGEDSEEWNGFSDENDGQEDIAVPHSVPTSAGQSEKKRKKKSNSK